MRIKSSIFKILALLLVLVTFSSVVVRPAAAHILESSGNIGGVIHIDPDDDPFFGVPSKIFIDIKDSQGKFEPDLCLCDIVITKAGEEIFNEPVKVTQDGSQIFVQQQFTFPERNIYEISLVGVSYDQSKFKDFKLSYEFRVTREPGSQVTNSTQNPGIFILAVVAVVVVFGGAAGYGYWKSKKVGEK